MGLGPHIDLHKGFKITVSYRYISPGAVSLGKEMLPSLAMENVYLLGALYSLAMGNSFYTTREF